VNYCCDYGCIVWECCFPRPPYSVKKKKGGGVSEESLLWVKGLGKSVVGYAISFLCRGWFLFSSSSRIYDGYSGHLLWAFTYIYI
jgi:hypothetical protein